MIRSAKYLLQPTKGQARRLDHLLWQQRCLYNNALAERKQSWDQDGRSLSRYQQFASLNGVAETNPDLGQYGVCLARGTLTRLDLAYKAFYRRCKTGRSPATPGSRPVPGSTRCRGPIRRAGSSTKGLGASTPRASATSD